MHTGIDIDINMDRDRDIDKDTDTDMILQMWKTKVNLDKTWLGTRPL
jgi:hypothetical protein